MTFHRFTRQELLDLVWSKPMRDVAAGIGVSDVAMKKACRNADVTTPPQGHWNRVHAGRTVVAKPTLSPRGFGASDEVTFGHEPWNVRRSDIELESEILPPVFEEPMECVRERATKAVGRISVSRDLDRFAHDAIRKILRDEAARASWLIESGETWGWEIQRKGPRFSKPGDMRRLRLLSAIALGIARGGVKVRDWSGDDLCLRIETAGGPLTLEAGMTPVEIDRRRQAAGEVLTVSLSGSSDSQDRPLHAWRDQDDRRLETRVGEIAVDALVACEEHYRDQLTATYKHREAVRLRTIEDNEKKRLEAERKERERREQLERERVERLLAEAEQLRCAQAIRAYVAEVERLQAEGGSPADEASLLRWKAWALAQADRIDPVVSGAFVQGLAES